MCGRYALTLPQDAVNEYFDIGTDLTDAAPPRTNICPTQTIATVRLDGDRQLVPMRWGFVPGWYKTTSDGPLLINARAETVADKPAFRAACRQRRCLIPASGFFEWSGTKDTGKQPWYIHPGGNAPLALAGIWQDWTDATGQVTATCAIVTTTANATLAPIHTRMPVIIAPDDFDLWLGAAGKGAARLMQPCADDALQAHKVSPRINAASASGEDLIAPI